MSAQELYSDYLRNSELQRESQKQAYQALRTVCDQLDDKYWGTLESSLRVGHYDDGRQEIQFYDVDSSRIPELRSYLDAVDVPYDLFQSFIDDNVWLVMIRPKLITV